MSNITWNIEGIYAATTPLKACIGNLQSASSQCSSIKIPADFGGAGIIRSVPGEIDGIIGTVQNISSTIQEIARKFESAENKNNRIIDDMLYEIFMLGGENVQISNNSEITFFYKDIEYEMKWNEIEGNKYVKSYFEIVPKNVDENTKVAFWLHGKGGLKINDTGLQSSLLGYKGNDDLMNPNLHIVIPHLRGNENTNWAQDIVRDEVLNLVQSEKFSGKDKIIGGHSLGAHGALYYAERYPELFNKVLVCSPYKFNGSEVQINPENIKIPTRIYYTNWDDANCKNFTAECKEIEGIEVIEIEKVRHTDIAKYAYNIDEDDDGKSDFMQWWLGENETSNTDE